MGKISTTAYHIRENRTLARSLALVQSAFSSRLLANLSMHVSDDIATAVTVGTSSDNSAKFRSYHFSSFSLFSPHSSLFLSIVISCPHYIFLFLRIFYHLPTFTFSSIFFSFYISAAISPTLHSERLPVSDLKRATSTTSILRSSLFRGVRSDCESVRGRERERETPF